MPIYEYQCESCGAIVENWQKITDPPLETCQSCGGKMKKLISHSSFHLKGSGWYVTDYAGKTSSGSQKNKKGPSGGKERPGQKTPGKSPSSGNPS